MGRLHQPDLFLSRD